MVAINPNLNRSQWIGYITPTTFCYVLPPLLLLPPAMSSRTFCDDAKVLLLVSVILLVLFNKNPFRYDFVLDMFVFVVPLFGVLVRFRVNYTPKEEVIRTAGVVSTVLESGQQVGAGESRTEKDGEKVRGYAHMVRKVFVVEVRFSFFSPHYNVLTDVSTLHSAGVAYTSPLSLVSSFGSLPLSFGPIYGELRAPSSPVFHIPSSPSSLLYTTNSLSGRLPSPSYSSP